MSEVPDPQQPPPALPSGEELLMALCVLGLAGGGIASVVGLVGGEALSALCGIVVFFGCLAGIVLLSRRPPATPQAPLAAGAAGMEVARSEGICPLCRQLRFRWFRTREGIVVCDQCFAAIRPPRGKSRIPLGYWLARQACVSAAGIGVLAVLAGIGGERALNTIGGLLMFWGAIVSAILIQIAGLMARSGDGR